MAKNVVLVPAPQEQDESQGEDSFSEKLRKKKQQNALRWKRWWTKNRESYNERRRLSAHTKNLKSKVDRPKTRGKRMRSESEETPTEEIAPLVLPSPVSNTTPLRPFQIDPVNFMQAQSRVMLPLHDSIARTFKLFAPSLQLPHQMPYNPAFGYQRGVPHFATSLSGVDLRVKSLGSITTD